MWMSSHKQSSPLFLNDSFSSRPKRDLLRCVARHTGRHTSLQCALSKAQSPGLSVSHREPSGVVSLSRFCATSSRSLGRCLLLGQRSRMNLFSNNVGSLVFQYRINPCTEFSRHCHNGDAGPFAAWVSAANRAIKLSKLRVLADRRPGRLNQLASKPSVAEAGNRAPIDPISRGVLGWHQAQKASQLPDIVDFTPVSHAPEADWPQSSRSPGCSSGRQWTATVPHLLYRSGESLWYCLPPAFQRIPKCRATDRA